MVTVLTSPKVQSPVTEELLWWLSHARTPRLRDITHFAEQEITVPSGDYAGRRFKADRQPWVPLYFAAVMQFDRYKFVAATGPTQDGKSLCCLAIPAMYHLFERKEPLIIGVPRMEMAEEKWKGDFLSAIEGTRFRDLLPLKGRGSRSGWSQLMVMRHGPTVRFMSANGGDEARSGSTAPILVATEVDKYDECREGSEETSPINQMVARTSSFHGSGRYRVYMECTVTHEGGEIWRRIKGGTDSRIAAPCPHCEQYITLERENLIGWSQAATVMQARRLATFVCPACGGTIDERERHTMQRRAVLVHSGQEIVDGVVTGDPPDTDTLGFRWNAANSVLKSAEECGAAEWRAERSTASDSEERNVSQYLWAVPTKPPTSDVVELDKNDLVKRTIKLKRGVVPEDAKHLAVGIDIRKRELHYTVLAWRENRQRHVVDYDVRPIAGDTMDPRRAIYIAVESFLLGTCLPGWQKHGGGVIKPGAVWIDANWQGEERGSRGGAKPVYELSRKHKILTSTIGHGASVYKGGVYQAPDKRTRAVAFIGADYHGVRIPEHGIVLMHVDTDTWKVELRTALSLPLVMGEGGDTPGAMTLFSGDQGAHNEYASHITAETPVREWKAEKGHVVRWSKANRPNHWLDSTTLALVALDFLGGRVLDAEPAKRTEWGKNRTRPGKRRRV